MFYVHFRCYIGVAAKQYLKWDVTEGMLWLSTNDHSKAVSHDWPGHNNYNLTTNLCPSHALGVFICSLGEVWRRVQLAKPFITVTMCVFLFSVFWTHNFENWYSLKCEP